MVTARYRIVEDEPEEKVISIAETVGKYGVYATKVAGQVMIMVDIGSESWFKGTWRFVNPRNQHTMYESESGRETLEKALQAGRKVYYFVNVEDFARWVVNYETDS